MFYFCRVPFDTKTYLGFYVELVVQMFTVHYYMLTFSSTISIFYAFHIFIDGLVTDYSMALDKFNKKLKDHIKSKSARQKNPIQQLRQETHQFLKESVDLHSGILK